MVVAFYHPIVLRCRNVLLDSQKTSYGLLVLHSLLARAVRHDGKNFVCSTLFEIFVLQCSRNRSENYEL